MDDSYFNHTSFRIPLGLVHPRVTLSIQAMLKNILSSQLQGKLKIKILIIYILLTHLQSMQTAVSEGKGRENKDDNIHKLRSI